MVIEQTKQAVDSLKGRPKEDRAAVAGGVAIGVVIVLIIAWGFFFFKKIQRGAPVQLSAGAQDEFNFQSVKDAQQALLDTYSDQADELRRLRDEAAAAKVSDSVAAPVNLQPSDDLFSPPDSVY